MKPHLIAVDLDGTLLSDNKTISKRNQSVLFRLRQLGHQVMIATGRPFRTSKNYYQALSLDSPMVNFNGAFIHHPLSPSTFETVHTPLDQQTAKTIIDTCEDFHVRNVIVEVLDDFYLRYKNRGFSEAFTLNQTPVGFGQLGSIVENNPTSILIHPNENHEKLTKHLSDSHAEIIHQRSWGAPWHIIEIVKAGLSKAVGLEKIATHYDIPQDRIIAFGDEDNDLEMIEYAGCGVAMENAIDPLKSLANEKTTTNEQDGVAVFLEKRFNL